ncbi:hypothetical protein [Sphingomonas sp. IW22]|uniref:hypothetical protein n=1 Tax=Sphingomonas sp. IW22 TaxID=3242489 RepID=UPI00351FE03B
MADLLTTPDGFRLVILPLFDRGKHERSDGKVVSTDRIIEDFPPNIDYGGAALCAADRASDRVLSTI